MLAVQMGGGLDVFWDRSTSIVAVNHRDPKTSPHDQRIWGIAGPRFEGHCAAEGYAQVVL